MQVAISIASCILCYFIKPIGSNFLILSIIKSFTTKLSQIKYVYKVCGIVLLACALFTKWEILILQEYAVRMDMKLFYLVSCSCLSFDRKKNASNVNHFHRHLCQTNRAGVNVRKAQYLSLETIFHEGLNKESKKIQTT